VLLLCLAGLTAIGAQVRCIDAAREAARLAARGDEPSARAVVATLAGEHARVQIRRDGDFAVAVVRLDRTILPGVSLGAQAVSALESGGG